MCAAFLMLLKLTVSIITLSVHLPNSGGPGGVSFLSFVRLRLTGTCVYCSLPFLVSLPPVCAVTPLQVEQFA